MEKYYSITTMTIYNENLEEVRKFKYTNDVKDLVEIVRKDTAGEKALAELKKLKELKNGWYEVVKGFAEGEAVAAAAGFKNKRGF